MKNHLKVLIFLIWPVLVLSQADSLVFKNGNFMVGEIKSMDRGVFLIETDYSDDDFKFEWSQIYAIKTSSLFFITLTDGTKYYGTIESTAAPEGRILAIDNRIIECDLNDIVNLQQLKKTFWDRLYASIDLGLSLAKANDLKQYTSRSTIGYRAEKWNADATFNTFFSTQSNAEDIERSDGKLNYFYVFPMRLYGIATFTMASNTEQKLDLRVNAQLGVGRFFIRTNDAYWGAKIGANRNIERYSSDTEDRNTWEGLLGTELNLYDIGDLSLFASIAAYPGITEKKRLRADFNLDTKYDLPYDFYIKIGLTVNYDNRPAEGAGETDYVFQTGFGWEW